MTKHVNCTGALGNVVVVYAIDYKRYVDCVQ